MTHDEKWILIESGYRVSDQGRVANPSGKLLRPFVTDRAGHVAVKLPSRREYVHRLVAAAFIGPPKPGQEVRHLNNVADDNRAENLAWGTRSQNVLDLRSKRTRCPHGHEFTIANTYIQTNGWRRCRECKRGYRR